MLEVWTAHLRAWLASELLQPLVAAVERAQQARTAAESPQWFPRVPLVSDGTLDNLIASSNCIAVVCSGMADLCSGWWRATGETVTQLLHGKDN